MTMGSHKRISSGVYGGRRRGSMPRLAVRQRATQSGRGGVNGMQRTGQDRTGAYCVMWDAACVCSCATVLSIEFRAKLTVDIEALSK
jgi:hypothetical protein